MAVVASPMAAVFAYFPFTLMEAEPKPPVNLVSISLLKLFLIPFPAASWGTAASSSVRAISISSPPIATEELPIALVSAPSASDWVPYVLAVLPIATPCAYLGSIVPPDCLILTLVSADAPITTSPLAPYAAASAPATTAPDPGLPCSVEAMLFAWRPMTISPFSSACAPWPMATVLAGRLGVPVLPFPDAFAPVPMAMPCSVPSSTEAVSPMAIPRSASLLLSQPIAVELTPFAVEFAPNARAPAARAFAPLPMATPQSPLD